jgi:hypothetical protein
MTDWQLSPAGLLVPPTAADGAYLAHKDGTRFTEFLRMVDGTNTTVTISGDTVQIDAAAPLIVPLTTSINGVPELVWDSNNQLVFTEVPAV